MTFALPTTYRGALAQIKVGVSRFGHWIRSLAWYPRKNTFALLPKEISGQKVQYIVLDDATDGPMVYGLAFQLLVEASTLMLLTVSVVMH